MVGGVYLRLLVANPSWVLRKPKSFVSDLFDALLDQLVRVNNDVSYNSVLFCFVLQKVVCSLCLLLLSNGVAHADPSPPTQNLDIFIEISFKTSFSHM